MYIVVSSANNIDLATFKLSGRSFVYIINYNGPNTNSYGTHIPYFGQINFDFCSGHIVFCLSDNFCSDLKLCL